MRPTTIWFKRFAARLGCLHRVAVAADIQPRLADETLRLLGARDYPAVVISAVTHLDALLRAALEKDEPLPVPAYALDP